ncbi:MAG: hypothetical protein K8E66_05850, partial [Phycisphaerales bacterium]|nr:hypothetical protein [Phycisphaerales bacterium]
MTDHKHTIPVVPRLIVLLASALALAASAGGAGVAMLGTSQTLWASLGFTLIALFAALIGVVAGL